jgi:hypothetical protein
LGKATGSAKVGHRRPDAGEVLEVALAPRTLRRLAGDHRGLRIRCTGAALWITQDGDPADYCLDAGEQFTVTRPGLIVLQGLENWQE